MIRFLLVFLLIQGGLFYIELMEPVREAFIIPFTTLLAKTSAWIVQWFDDDVISYGIILESVKNKFAVSIEAGCNGVEAVIILVAAILAYPAPWKYKLTGVIIGTIAIQLLNLVRIISLFYLGQWSKEAFEWAHLYIWQALIMLDAIVVFLVWLSRIPKTDDESRVAAHAA